MTAVQQLYRFINKHAIKILVGGLLWIGWHNWRQWHQETRLLCKPIGLPPLPSRDTWTDTPMVSVLVAAWNEEEHLAAFIQSFRGLEYPHKELVLCVGGADRGYSIASEFVSSEITILEQHESDGKFDALKRALTASKGPLVYLTDADCILNTDSFLRVIYPLVEEGESLVTGHIRPLSNQLKYPMVMAQWASYQKFQAEELSSASKYTTHITGANCALTRTLFEECCQSSNKVQIGEDLYLALYAHSKGHQIFRVYESYVESEFPTTIGAYVRQQCRWNKTKLIYHTYFGEMQTVRIYTGMAHKRQILLCIPLLALLFGKMGTVGWILAWTYGFSPYLQSQLFASKIAAQPRMHLGQALLLMVATYYAWAIAPLELRVSKWKNRW